MLTVIIVGGGIAGLSTALALRRAGHLVHIYERSSFSNEVGAAIYVASNASRALIAWGLDPLRANFTKARGRIHAKGDTLETLYSSDFDYVEKIYGAPWFFAHRIDLHKELKLLATGEGEGQPAILHMNREVECYISEDSSVRFLDGAVATADLIVAADGVHSRALELILGKPNPPYSPGVYNYCYLFLIPTEEIAADPDTNFWIAGGDGRFKLFFGKSKRLVSYPCRNDTIQNFVAILHNDNVDAINKEDWQAPINKSELLDRFSDFHPKILTVLKKATDVKQWPLLSRAPLPVWQIDRLALVGDAAHPMLPFHGQGGAQAIEDAVALGIALIGALPDQVGTRLKLYEAIRKKRASAVQTLSSVDQTEIDLVRKEVEKFIPANRVPGSPKEFQDFNLGYDIVQDSIKQIRRVDPAFSIPPRFFQQEPGKGLYPRLESNGDTHSA